jgi:hypothetical protein
VSFDNWSFGAALKLNKDTGRPPAMKDGRLGDEEALKKDAELSRLLEDIDNKDK